MVYHRRNLQRIIELNKCDMSVILNESNVFYFTRFPRAYGTILIALRDGSWKVVTPLLDFWRASDSLRDVEVIPYAPYNLEDVSKELGIKVKSLESIMKSFIKKLKITKLCTDDVCRIKKYVDGDVKIIDISDDVSRARAIKDSEELELIRHALQITEEALWRVLESLMPGLREVEVAGLLESSMKYLGACGYAFDTIVASGPNSSYPHAVPTSREIKLGDVVVIDLGAKYSGYSSDMTRTVVLGKVDEEIRKVFDAIVEAIHNAVDVIRDGVKAGEVDRAARDTLKKYGLSKYFIHSTGHGVGIDVHEIPRLSQSSDEILREGMVITIEPGVYIHGRYGVRIENMVVVRKRKGEVLNKKPLLYSISA